MARLSYRVADRRWNFLLSNARPSAHFNCRRQSCQRRSKDASVFRSKNAVLFCDLRGFSAFSELAEPEEVIQVMREYHVTLGKFADKYEGTVERFTGDGLLIVFNDPMPCPDPCLRAAHMAVEMRDEVAKLSQKWNRLGHELGFGVGIA